MEGLTQWLQHSHVAQSRRIFDQQLGRDILLSERQRTLVLACAFGASPLLIFVHGLFLPIGDLYQDARLAYLIVGIIGFVTEFTAWLILRHYTERDASPPELGRYLLALVEMSLPTLLIWFAAKFGHPHLVLLGPAVPLYVGFILLGVLQLRFRICLFRGIVAALGYSIVAGSLLGRVVELPPDQIFLVMGAVVGNTLIFLAAGLAGGFVAAQIRLRFSRSINVILEQNREIAGAYDASLEGWSHALDLRDNDTEGHSQRVAELTLRLAQQVGVKPDELIHIRRGALLHDIGKMGVPDQILRKPGPLTEQERMIMKQHPTFAFELLAPISFLKPALDIPYCHHEKWDGSGYPRGLKGEAIPLAARLFAVVDVWDALTSDRPYREAWSAERVREHMCALAGTHFDPQVVMAFMSLNQQTN